jgi:hypothetical protein
LYVTIEKIMDIMAFSNATQLITICDEKDIMFSSQIDVEIESKATSNVEVDGVGGFSHLSY